MAKKIQGWVYLMLDQRSGFYKIGYSTKPQFREKTLQAEVPLIDIVEAWMADQREEYKLHGLFKEKRLRGEWFRLDDDDLYEIHWYFSNRKRFKAGKSLIEEHDESLARHEERLRRINEAINRGNDEELFYYMSMASAASELDFLTEAFGIEI